MLVYNRQGCRAEQTVADEVDTVKMRNNISDRSRRSIVIPRAGTGELLSCMCAIQELAVQDAGVDVFEGVHRVGVSPTTALAALDACLTLSSHGVPSRAEFLVFFDLITEERIWVMVMPLIAFALPHRILSSLDSGVFSLFLAFRRSRLRAFVCRTLLSFVTLAEVALRG